MRKSYREQTGRKLGMKKGKERQVETRGSNYLRKCLCAQRCIQGNAGHGNREVVKGNYLNTGSPAFDPGAMTTSILTSLCHQQHHHH